MQLLRFGKFVLVIGFAAVAGGCFQPVCSAGSCPTGTALGSNSVAAANSGGSATASSGATTASAASTGGTGTASSTSNGSTSEICPLGSLGFAAKLGTVVGQGPTQTIAADLNGDGLPDLVVANQTDETVSVLLNMGGGAFSPQAAYSPNVAVPPEGLYAAVADFNGDGRPDIAISNARAGRISVFMNAGDGAFTPQGTYTTNASPGLIVSGDFNHDGHTDLAVVLYLGTAVGVLLNEGNGTFASAVAYSVAPVPGFLAVADFDGDGNPDLALTHAPNGSAGCGNSSRSKRWKLCARGPGPGRTAAS